MLCIQQIQDLCERERWVEILLEKSILTAEEQEWVETQLKWLQQKRAKFEWSFCCCVEQFNVLYAAYVDLDCHLSEILSHEPD